MCRVWGLGFRVLGLGSRVSHSDVLWDFGKLGKLGFRIWGLGFRVMGFRV